MKNERMGLIVYNQYNHFKKLRQLEATRNGDWIKRFQDCDLPSHFDKLLSFCNKPHVQLKRLKNMLYNEHKFNYNSGEVHYNPISKKPTISNLSNNCYIFESGWITLYLTSDDILIGLVFGTVLWIRNIHVIQKLTLLLCICLRFYLCCLIGVFKWYIRDLETVILICTGRQNVNRD